MKAFSQFTSELTKVLSRTPFDPNAAIQLISGGANPNTQNERGQTALHLISLMPDLKANKKVFFKLLDLNIHPSIRDKNWKTAFRYLLDRPNFEVDIALKMIRKGADPNTQNTQSRTLLMLLSFADDEIVNTYVPQLLNSDRCDLSLTDFKKNTALFYMLSRKKNNVNIIIQMMRKGGDANTYNVDECTFLHSLAKAERWVASQYMPVVMELGGNLECRDGRNKTVLSYLLDRTIDMLKESGDSAHLGKQFLKSIFSKSAISIYQYKMFYETFLKEVDYLCKKTKRFLKDIETGVLPCINAESHLKFSGEITKYKRMCDLFNKHNLNTNLIIDELCDLLMENRFTHELFVFECLAFLQGESSFFVFLEKKEILSKELEAKISQEKSTRDILKDCASSEKRKALEAKLKPKVSQQSMFSSKENRPKLSPAKSDSPLSIIPGEIRLKQLKTCMPNVTLYYNKSVRKWAFTNNEIHPQPSSRLTPK